MSWPGNWFPSTRQGPSGVKHTSHPTYPTSGTTWAARVTSSTARSQSGNTKPRMGVPVAGWFPYRFFRLSSARSMTVPVSGSMGATMPPLLKLSTNLPLPMRNMAVTRYTRPLFPRMVTIRTVLMEPG